MRTLKTFTVTLLVTLILGLPAAASAAVAGQTEPSLTAAQGLPGDRADHEAGLPFFKRYVDQNYDRVINRVELRRAGHTTPFHIHAGYPSPEASFIGAPGDTFLTYDCGLERVPDVGGFQLRLSQAKTEGILFVANEIARSVEFRLRYGNLSDAEFVHRAYYNCLRRPAEAAGFVFWYGKLQSGELNRGGVLHGIATSPERRLLKFGDYVTWGDFLLHGFDLHESELHAVYIIPELGGRCEPVPIGTPCIPLYPPQG